MFRPKNKRVHGFNFESFASHLGPPLLYNNAWLYSLAFAIDQPKLSEKEEELKYLTLVCLFLQRI